MQENKTFEHDQCDKVINAFAPENLYSEHLKVNYFLGIQTLLHVPVLYIFFK